MPKMRVVQSLEQFWGNVLGTGDDALVNWTRHFGELVLVLADRRECSVVTRQSLQTAVHVISERLTRLQLKLPLPEALKILGCGFESEQHMLNTAVIICQQAESIARWGQPQHSPRLAASANA